MKLELQKDAPDVLKHIGLMALGAVGGSLVANTLQSGMRGPMPSLLVASGGTLAALFAKKPAVRALGSGMAVAGMQKLVARQMPALAGTLEGWADATAELQPPREVHDIGYTVVEDMGSAAYVPMDFAQ